MSPRVLVVDDSSIIRSHCRIILQNAGYEVIEAWDSAQARSALEQMDIAFMLCDLNLPGMNGLELIEALRTQPKFATLPTAILTAECDIEQLRRSKRAGVTHWLLKPYTAEELLDVVTKHVVLAE